MNPRSVSSSPVTQSSTKSTKSTDQANLSQPLGDYVARERYRGRQCFPLDMRLQPLFINDQRLVAVTVEESPRDPKPRGIGILELDLSEDSSLPWRHFQLPWPASERAPTSPRAIGLVNGNLLLLAQRRRVSREQASFEFFILAFDLRQAAWTGRASDGSWQPVASAAHKIEAIHNAARLIAYVDDQNTLQVHADNTPYHLDDWRREPGIDQHLIAQKLSLRRQFPASSAGMMTGDDFVCAELGVKLTGFATIPQDFDELPGDRAQASGMIFSSLDSKRELLVTTQLTKAIVPSTSVVAVPAVGVASTPQRLGETLESCLIRFELD